LSPLLFNKYLEETMKKSALLQRLIGRGDLIAYADDLLVLANDGQELKLAIEEIKKLEPLGVHINIKKTQIMTNRQDMGETTEIKGVRLSEKIRYLETDIYCQREKTVKSIKY
jgi:hypothetical protein